MTNTTKKRIPKRTPYTTLATGSFFPDDRSGAGNIAAEDIGEAIDDEVDEVVVREAGA